jgi:uncharacterized protein (TIGR02186 family)
MRPAPAHLIVLAVVLLTASAVRVSESSATAATSEERAKTAAQKKDAARAKKAASPADAATPAAQPSETGPAAATAAPPTAEMAPEHVEADVSTRQVAVTTVFKGTEIIVFGTVENSRQSSAESGYYDVIVVLEGAPGPLVVRKKSRVAGLWVNSSSVTFTNVPSYHAIVSTRPLEEIADRSLLDQNAIGLDSVGIGVNNAESTPMPIDEHQEYQLATVRLKQQEGLFLKDEYGVAFIGRSLFRATIGLPANIPVGQLGARVYLFREGKLLSQYGTRVSLARTGVERVLYDFARERPYWYGIVAVIIAVAAGFLASTWFRRANT